MQRSYEKDFSQSVYHHIIFYPAPYGWRAVHIHKDFQQGRSPIDRLQHL